MDVDHGYNTRTPDKYFQEQEMKVKRALQCEETAGGSHLIMPE